MSTIRPSSVESSAFDIKGSSFTLLIFCLRTTQLPELEKQLYDHLSKTPDYFNFDPIVIDLSNINQTDVKLDFKSLINILRRHRLTPVGICNGSEIQAQIANKYGLGVFIGLSGKIKPKDTSTNSQPLNSDKTIELPSHLEKKRRETPSQPTKIITRPVRTGQQIYAQGCDLVVLASVNAGAEIISDGNIHVYAPLRGRALAGVKGDTTARIFCQCMEAELVSIAGCYRVLEENLPQNLQGEAVQISLNGEKLIIEPLLSHTTDNKRTANWQK